MLTEHTKCPCFCSRAREGIVGLGFRQHSVQSLYHCSAPVNAFVAGTMEDKTSMYQAPVSVSSPSLPPTPIEAILGELSLPFIFGLYYARGSENYYGSRLTLGGPDVSLIASTTGAADLQWFGVVGVASAGGGSSIYENEGPWEWSINLVRVDIGERNERYFIACHPIAPTCYSD